MLGALAQLAGQTTMPRGGAEAEADGSTMQHGNNAAMQRCNMETMQHAAMQRCNMETMQRCRNGTIQQPP